MPAATESTSVNWMQRFDDYFSPLTSSSPVKWNRTTLSGLLALVAIWAAWFYGTWAHWGNVTTDCGREMYVPSVLAQGKMLYRDVWYLYGPVAPYLNSYLFRIFGVQLSVLYWAGSLSALGSAILLYLAGMRLSSWLAGWTAGAVLLCQAFHPSLFSFPLPYSFASVYGCLIACLFLWLVIRASASTSSAWTFVAAIAAALALLLKLEFGVACYGTLALLIAARGFQQRSWKSLLRDVAVTLPGVAICGLVIRWMISMRGIDFLTQDNLMSWPTSFFMRTYGKYWLGVTGLSLTGSAFGQAALRTLVLVGIVQGFHLIANFRKGARRTVIVRSVLFLTCLIYHIFFRKTVFLFPWLILGEALRLIFFPQDTVLYVAVGAIAAWWFLWRERASHQALALALTLTFASLLACRVLLKMIPWEYPIYYDGAAILSLVLLLSPLTRGSFHAQRLKLNGEALICGMFLVVAVLNRNQSEIVQHATVYLNTERGVIKLNKAKAQQYEVAIKFMKEKKSQGETVMTVPEDTSLYFFSGVNCPTRVFEFTPGIVAPGRMTEETIQQIEHGNVRYLIWSNRLFPEYEVLRWGIDFDKPLGDYLLSHYRLVGPLMPGKVRFGEWTAFIWERKPEVEPR